MTAPIVIIGGGMAAGNAAVELRESGFDGEVVLFAGEPHPPYERPPLSKGYLAGKAEVEDTYLKPSQWYADQHIDVRTGTRVERIDPDGHVVHATDGSQSFSQLLIATGAQPRRLPLESTDHTVVAYLRTLDDSTHLRARAIAGSHALGRRRRLDRHGGRRPRRAAPAPRSPSSSRPSSRWSTPSARSSGNGWPTFTAGTASTCAPRRGWTRWGTGRRSSATAPGSRSTPSWSGSVPRPMTSWPGVPASTWTTASWWTRVSGPATPTSSPPVTSPTTRTRCSGSACASSTGRAPSARASSSPMR